MVHLPSFIFYVFFFISHESVSHMWTSLFKCVVAQKALRTADILYIPPTEATDDELIKLIR
jgi:hypothetical protein